METPSTARYECDPDGDIILVLRNTDTPFAVWDETAEPAAHVPRPSSEDNVDEVTSEPTDEEEPFDDHVEPTASEPTSADEVQAFEDVLEHVGLPSELPLLELRVSSRHLILASTYFQRMLKGNWDEHNTLKSEGCLHLEISDWDVDAVMILMDVIHGRSWKVPKMIDLELLAKIAVLVDYYGCLEVFEMFSTFWIDRLKTTIPRNHQKDLILWLCIAWVFQKSDLFEEVSTVAVMHSTGPVQTMNLPILDKITRKSFQSLFARRNVSLPRRCHRPTPSRLCSASRYCATHFYS
jgi:hypothetical protein